MSLILIEADELKEILRQVIREELNGLTVADEIGGMELAERVTGLKAATIYERVKNRDIPFFQDKKGGEITFHARI